MADAAGLARIMDECEHGSTLAFCGPCKAKDPKSREAARLARLRRERNARSWATDKHLPFPNTTAQWGSPCPDCDERIAEGDTIYLVGGKWVDEQCALDSAVMGET